jgi:hypothetical protein
MSKTNLEIQRLELSGRSFLKNIINTFFLVNKMKKKSFKKWLLEKHHLLILVFIFIIILAGVFLMNSENLGVDFKKDDSKELTSSQENSLEEKQVYVPKTITIPVSAPTPTEPKPVDYSNFIPTVLANEMISDLPKDGSISLNTFNFNTGERQIEKTYLLKKDSVVESKEAADIYVNFHSKYVNQVTQNNLCEILTKANNNGDFGAWTELEESTLIWRYKGMLKYRDCLGL